MISEDAVTLKPRMPLLISLRSVITVFDCSADGSLFFPSGKKPSAAPEGNLAHAV